MIIFDECHRSQFGDMQQSIKKAFKKYMMFGFTGTPISDKNAKSFGVSKDFNKSINAQITTKQIFSDCLHAYTLANAIRDENVLPFKVSYHSTMKKAEEIKDEQVQDIAREKALKDSRRIEKIVSYVLEHFDTQTKRNEHYKHKEKALRGFNSLFACSDIEAARLYYTEFQRQMQNLDEDKRLKIGIIYSFGANEAINEDEFDGEETQSSKEFLEQAIKDYNALFGTNFDISKFYNYYENIGTRMKNRELDMLIVVNMFLTGFDATTLNTLWVDKNLQYQGLLQAFSRTNRILNSVKSFGNVVCFRNLEEKTNESIALFSSENDNASVVLIKSFREYLEGFTDEKGEYQKGYKELVKELETNFKDFTKIAISGSDKEKKAFVELYNNLLRLHNILNTFEEFKNEELLSDRQKQELQSAYLHIYEEIKQQRQEQEKPINEDLVFEIELINEVDISFEYVLYLIEKMGTGKDKERELKALYSLVDSSLNLRSKKDLIEEFIETINPQQSNVREDFGIFIENKMKSELNAMIAKFNLNQEEAFEFINKSFIIGYVQELGEDIERVLPKMGFFGSAGEKRKEIKSKTLNAFRAFYERFKDIARENLRA